MINNLQVEDILHGFKVERAVELKELDAVLYQMKHMKTELELVWISRAEENKVFGISFETLPWNDTGVFHILEHSVLCGSKNYPVKEPFVELMKNSMNTFLNAMTFPDKTFYPIASRNNKDFVNLMRVYLDAVFYPAVYTKPEIFEQEGWHYEIDEDKNVSYKGVVFNEMKGAFADASELLEMAMNRAMFPDTPYRFVSGGDPASIPDLTYEEFVNSHRKFYSPSNAYIYLDGAIDIDSVLNIIDEEYLSSFEKTKRLAPPAFQSPIDAGEQHIEYEIGVEENTEGKTRLAWGKVVGTYADREKMIAMEILSDVLCGNNQAVLNRVVLEDGSAESVSMQLYDSVANPWVRLEVRNLKEEDCEKLEKRIYGTLASLADGQLDHERLEASLANLEFRMRERDYGGYPQGLVLGMQVLESWLYGGKPEANLEIGELFENLRKKLKDGYFEQLIRDILIDNKHCCKVILTASHTAGVKRRELENSRIEKETSAWTQEQRNEYIGRQNKLTEWQNSEDTPKQLATLPHLSLSDIEKAPEAYQVQEVECDGKKVLLHHINTNGIVYANMYFDADSYSQEELPVLSFLSSLLGHIDTLKSRAEQLSNKARLLCGIMNFSIESYDIKHGDKKYTTKFVASFSTIEKNLNQAVNLVAEILTQTDFNSENAQKAVKDILLQMKMGIFQSIVMNGHSAALRRVQAQISHTGVIGECTGGISYYMWLKNQAENWNWEELKNRLCNLYDRVISKDAMTVSVAGNADAAVNEIMKQLSDMIPSKKKEEPVNITPWGVKREGIVIPADISFAVCGGLIPSSEGEWSTALKIISLSYLWNVIRVQGGAYGTGMLMSNGKELYCYSYRDPSAKSSLEKYMGCAEFLKQTAMQNPDLTGYIIGTISDQSPLKTPRLKAKTADQIYWRKITWQERCDRWNQIIETTPEKLQEVAQQIDASMQKSGVCVVGGAEQMDGCSLDSIITL